MQELLGLFIGQYLFNAVTFFSILMGVRGGGRGLFRHKTLGENENRSVSACGIVSFAAQRDCAVQRADTFSFADIQLRFIPVGEEVS